MNRKGIVKKSQATSKVIFDNQINASQKDICLCDVYVNDTKLRFMYVTSQYNMNKERIFNWCERKSHDKIDDVRLVPVKVVGVTSDP